MSQDYLAGDFLIFQIEAGYALLRLLSVEDTDEGKVWHVAAYDDLFLDVENADAAISDGRPFKLGKPHIALTTRAFEATQTARMGNRALESSELEPLEDWRASDECEVSDLSVRLLLGLR
ncbi:MAG TPA: hypothetical protein VMM38_02470 [Aridibacter sp.]|nr:hypothetical protein [Aridibacter sp.]